MTHIEYSDVFRDTRAVDKYEQEVYAPDTYASVVSARQRLYLRRLVRCAFTDRRAVQHDFACGTGRAVRMLAGLVRAAHGYDPSPEMLDRARAAGVRAEWHTIPATGPVPEPATVEIPAIVTMFRLVLNVPDYVRRRAFTFAARALPDAGSGLLVVENHGNATSLRHLAARRRRGQRWFSELSHAQVRRLLGEHGFTVVAMRGFAFLPAAAYRRAWLRPVARRLDDLLCRMGWLSRFAIDVLYVARREG